MSYPPICERVHHKLSQQLPETGATDPNMASLEILDELPPIWFQYNRHQTIEFIGRLLPLLTHGLRARREAIHQHALLLSALTNLGLILFQVHVPVLSHVSLSDLDMHLTKTCQVLDDILHGRLRIVSEELRRDADVDLTTDLVLGDIEFDIDTINALAKSLERCDRRKQTVAPIRRHDSRLSTERKCHDHWQILFGHMSRSLPQLDPSCAMGHSAKVHLKHIYSGDPNMSLLVSNCLAEEWYPVYCEKKEYVHHMKFVVVTKVTNHKPEAAGDPKTKYDRVVTSVEEDIREGRSIFTSTRVNFGVRRVIPALLLPNKSFGIREALRRS